MVQDAQGTNKDMKYCAKLLQFHFKSMSFINDTQGTLGADFMSFINDIPGQAKG